MIKIEMQNVSIGYAHKEVLRDLTFAVLPGQMVGLVGPNGSGKSTIIRALTRVIPLQQGNIFLDGKNINPYLQGRVGPYAWCCAAGAPVAQCLYRFRGRIDG